MKTPRITPNVSRRSFLRYSAASLASLAASQVFTQRALAADSNIKRVVFWYVPEGAAQQAFWPSFGPGSLNINMGASIDGKNPVSRGDAFKSYAKSGDNNNGSMGTYCLQPLKAHEKDLTLVSGFKNTGAGASDPHQQVVQNALTGGTPNKGSVDQHLGDFLKGSSPYHAIFSSVYGEHIGFSPNPSYASPIRMKNGSSGNPTWNPVTVYNQIFPKGIDSMGSIGTPDYALHSRKAVLESVAAHLNAVKCAGGVESQMKLEAYLESFETIEKQTQALIDATPPSGTGVSVAIPDGWTSINSNNKYWHDPKNFAKMVKISIDTTVAALALDRTRVSLMQFSASGNSRGASGEHYKSLNISGIEGGTQDHFLGHEPDAMRRRDQARVFRWYYSQLAYMIERLKAIPDGNGSLFDSTLIVCCSEFGMYNHRDNDIPLILAGNPGGVFRKGVYIDAHNGNHRNLADFYLGICRAMGMNINNFGTSSTPYTGFLV
jgi:hypothetical protein